MCGEQTKAGGHLRDDFVFGSVGEEDAALALQPLGLLVDVVLALVLLGAAQGHGDDSVLAEEESVRAVQGSGTSYRLDCARYR